MYYFIKALYSYKTKNYKTEMNLNSINIDITGNLQLMYLPKDLIINISHINFARIQEKIVKTIFVTLSGRKQNCKNFFCVKAVGVNVKRKAISQGCFYHGEREILSLKISLYVFILYFTDISLEYIKNISNT